MNYICTTLQHKHHTTTEVSVFTSVPFCCLYGVSELFLPAGLRTFQGTNRRPHCVSTRGGKSPHYGDAQTQKAPTLQACMNGALEKSLIISELEKIINQIIYQPEA